MLQIDLSESNRIFYKMPLLLHLSIFRGFVKYDVEIVLKLKLDLQPEYCKTFFAIQIAPYLEHDLFVVHDLNCLDLRVVSY